jgi:hypoxanthine phosphoribosyltransferase
MNKEYITWNLYDHKVRNLITQVEESNFKPDLVVGIVRGGMIPAIMISHHFDVECDSFLLSFRDHKANGLDKVWGLCIYYHGKNILFVDDIVDSGKTMGALQKFNNKNLSSHWISSNPKPTIKYASVWFNTGQETKVDYSAVHFDRSNNQDWFVFPYEKQ